MKNHPSESPRTPRLLAAAIATSLAATPCMTIANEQPAPGGTAAEEAPAAPAPRVLALADAEKKEVRHGMIGITSTRIFYTFADEKAVITLHIDNSSPKLPVTTKVTLFDLNTSKEGIAKWLNNQHSDGLFVDPAEPIHVETLPEGTSTVTERKLLGEEKSPTNDETFADYEVKISVKEHIVPEKYKIPAFTGDAKVFLKMESL